MITFVSTSRSSSSLSTTTRERKRVLSSSFATSSRCSRVHFPFAKRREAFKPRSSPSSSSSSPTATTLADNEEYTKNTMTPIQLQDVARKHFENRERTRAQMVRLFYARANLITFSLGVVSDSAFFSLFVHILFETGGTTLGRVSLGEL